MFNECDLNRFIVFVLMLYHRLTLFLFPHRHDEIDQFLCLQLIVRLTGWRVYIVKGQSIRLVRRKETFIYYLIFIGIPFPKIPIDLLRHQCNSFTYSLLAEIVAERTLELMRFLFVPSSIRARHIYRLDPQRLVPGLRLKIHAYRFTRRQRKKLFDNVPVCQIL